MKKRDIVHIEIPAKGRKETAQFYEEMFGWEMTHMDEMDYSMWQAGNLGGGFPPVGGELNAVGQVMVHIHSDDIDSDLKKIEALGGKTVHPKAEVPGFGWWAAFNDPTGNTLALYTSAHPPVAE